MMAWVAWAVVPRGGACECGGHGKWQELMHDVQGSGVETVAGKGGIAPSDVFASHVHQRRRIVQNGWWGGGRAYPYPLRWRHAYTVLVGVVINQGAGPKVADSLHVWQRNVGWGEHMDVLQAHQWNGGGGACEGAEQ
jgi:hypothetical protein